MAITSCSECGKVISDKAVSCPHHLAFPPKEDMRHPPIDGIFPHHYGIPFMSIGLNRDGLTNSNATCDREVSINPMTVHQIQKLRRSNGLLWSG